MQSLTSLEIEQVAGAAGLAPSQGLLTLEEFLKFNVAAANAYVVKTIQEEKAAMLAYMTKNS